MSVLPPLTACRRLLTSLLPPLTFLSLTRTRHCLTHPSPPIPFPPMSYPSAPSIIPDKTTQDHRPTHLRLHSSSSSSPPNPNPTQPRGIYTRDLARDPFVSYPWPPPPFGAFDLPRPLSPRFRARSRPPPGSHCPIASQTPQPPG